MGPASLPGPSTRILGIQNFRSTADELTEMEPTEHELQSRSLIAGWEGMKWNTSPGSYWHSVPMGSCVTFYLYSKLYVVHLKRQTSLLVLFFGYDLQGVGKEWTIATGDRSSSNAYLSVVSHA